MALVRRARNERRLPVKQQVENTSKLAAILVDSLIEASDENRMKLVVALVRRARNERRLPVKQQAKNTGKLASVVLESHSNLGSRASATSGLMREPFEA